MSFFNVELVDFLRLAQQLLQNYCCETTNNNVGAFARAHSGPLTLTYVSVYVSDLTGFATTSSLQISQQTIVSLRAGWVTEMAD
jgi:hypothetical protein